MTTGRRPGKEARDVIEAALEPYAPSRTQLKKMASAVLDNWQVQLSPASDGRHALVLFRVDPEA